MLQRPPNRLPLRRKDANGVASATARSSRPSPTAVRSAMNAASGNILGPGALFASDRLSATCMRLSKGSVGIAVVKPSTAAPSSILAASF
jgi:hypothetical protein